MTIYLPNEIKLLIYSYGCKEIIIFDRDFYNYIKKLREEFIFNPLKIKYKIETWEYPLVRYGWSSLPQRYTVINKLNSHLKPIRNIDCSFNEIEISGFVSLGSINDLGEISNPTLEIKCMLIPDNVLYSKAHIYITTNVQYYDINKIIVEDIKRGKIYCNLWATNYNI